MADEQTPQDPIAANSAATDGAGAQRVYNLQRMYLKDASFELPGAPQIFQESGQPEFSLNLAQKVDELGEDQYEVVLSVTVTATIEEKTIYLAEVHQAGIFSIRGFSEQEHTAVLNTMCPHYLFPYARSAVTSLVAEGGFPPPPIQPVNFDQVYAQRLVQAQKEAEQQQEA